ncbi:hypothetical protein [Sediminicola luteus]|uniref:Uncharacterized protein n=1 Tax=Sediminicola luteus TaxID=319238 RepID=A0A2A4G571_9FLAO|nr:hypothetical protein [Sediminicola luteus]PCE63797.1 hypothetical protein B7P33_11030 [Sediminicola luteus]
MTIVKTLFEAKFHKIIKLKFISATKPTDLMEISISENLFEQALISQDQMKRMIKNHYNYHNPSTGK